MRALCWPGTRPELLGFRDSSKEQTQILCFAQLGLLQTGLRRSNGYL